MADIAFGSIEKVIKLALKIQKQAKTVRQNQEEWQNIEQCVGTLTGILFPLQQTAEVMIQPGIKAALLSLETTLDSALSLIRDCQESNAVRRFFGAGDMSRQLLRIQRYTDEDDDAGRRHQRAADHHHFDKYYPLPRCLSSSHTTTGVAEISYNNHLTTGDARSGANSGGGHSFGMMQKIVIKISMLGDDKSPSKAMALVAGADGVISLGITGDGKDLLEVVGTDVDTVQLIRYLRRKIGHADILKVEEWKQKKKKKPVELSQEEQEKMGGGLMGGVATAAVRQQGRNYSSSEGTRPIIEDLSKKKPEEPKAGARKSKKGWAMTCRAVWRQLRRGNRARDTAAGMGHGSGRGSSRLHHQDGEDEE